MFTASSKLHFILICDPTGIRKAIDGFSNIVAYDIEKEHCSEQLFVFCGRARNKITILQWSHNGFWLHYKRLEKATSNDRGLTTNR
jgi:transposase